MFLVNPAGTGGEIFTLEMLMTTADRKEWERKRKNKAKWTDRQQEMGLGDRSRGSRSWRIRIWGC